MDCDHLQDPVSLLRFLGSFHQAAQVEIVPAYDAVPDESVAAFGDLLIFLFGLVEAARISDRDGPSEAVRELDLVELLLDRLPQFDLVDVPQDEHRLDDLAEGFHLGEESVLAGIGFHAPEDSGSRRLFQPDGGDKAQQVIP